MPRKPDLEQLAAERLDAAEAYWEKDAALTDGIVAAHRSGVSLSEISERTGLDATEVHENRINGSSPDLAAIVKMHHHR